MALRRSASRIPRGPRRRTGWDFGPGSGGVDVISSSSTGFFGVQGATFLRQGDTLVRSRGDVEMFLTAVGASGDGFEGALGMGLASQNAVAAGIASVPTPITDIDWDGWVWHRMFSLHGSAATASEDNALPSRFFEIDSKAMRKVGTEMSLYLAFEMTEIGTAVMNLFGGVRVLIKLP